MSALRRALRDLPETVFADLLEGDDGYLLVIDVPGVTLETVDIRLTGGTLRIEATREKDVSPAFDYRTEGRSPTVDFEIPVPADTTGENATATLDRGVLEVRLPRRSRTDETTIPVETG